MSSIPLEIVYISMILSKRLKIPPLHVNTKYSKYLGSWNIYIYIYIFIYKGSEGQKP